MLVEDLVCHSLVCFLLLKNRASCPIPLGDASAATSPSTSILQLNDTTKKELEQVISITKEWEFQQEEAITSYPLPDPKFVGSRRQPKSKDEEEMLKAKYGQIHDVSERAYQILVDLGLV